jgi:hypothetical protein
VIGCACAKITLCKGSWFMNIKCIIIRLDWFTVFVSVYWIVSCFFL